MIDLLGMVLIATIVNIGLIDLKSGLSPFAVYRRPSVAGVNLQAQVTERPGDGSGPKPPASAK